MAATKFRRLISAVRLKMSAEVEVDNLKTEDRRTTNIDSGGDPDEENIYCIGSEIKILD